jgi:hypothetical protein
MALERLAYHPELEGLLCKCHPAARGGSVPAAVDEIRIVAAVEHVRIEDDVARHVRGGLDDHVGAIGTRVPHAKCAEECVRGEESEEAEARASEAGDDPGTSGNHKTAPRNKGADARGRSLAILLGSGLA